MIFNDHIHPEQRKNMTFIKITPNRKIFCYGLGINMIKLRTAQNKGEYTVFIPEERL